MNSKTAWAGVVSGAILLGGATGYGGVGGVADSDSNPYAVITDRNVFHLVAPPPPPAEKEQKADLPVINLSGFVKDGDDLRALLVVKTKEHRGTREGKEETVYASLAAGEKEGVVELVRIHEQEEAIDVINSGTPMTLTMKDNGFTPRGGGAGPGGPTGPINRSLPGIPNPFSQRGNIQGANAPVSAQGGPSTLVFGATGASGGGVVGARQGQLNWNGGGGAAPNRESTGGTMISGATVSFSNPALNSGAAGAIPLNIPLSSQNSLRPNSTPPPMSTPTRNGAPSMMPPPLPGMQ